MDSYHYQPSCPLHYSYPTSSYINQCSSPIIFHNHSMPNQYTQPSPSTQTHRSSPILNTTILSTPPVGRRRRQRTIFSKEQLIILEQVFGKSPYPDIQLREDLSQRVDIPEARIQVWFKNRRSRSRTSVKNTTQSSNVLYFSGGIC